MRKYTHTHMHSLFSLSLFSLSTPIQVPWPEQLYTHPDSAVGNDQDGAEVFRGMRVRIGVCV